MIRVPVRRGLVPNENAINDHCKRRLEDLRQRSLTPEEIAALISECYKSHHPFLRYVLGLLILTSARCGEIRLAKWFHIHMKDSALIGSVSKTGQRREMYLSQRAKNVILAICQNS